MTLRPDGILSWIHPCFEFQNKTEKIRVNSCPRINPKQSGDKFGAPSESIRSDVKIPLLSQDRSLQSLRDSTTLCNRWFKGTNEFLPKIEAYSVTNFQLVDATVRASKIADCFAAHQNEQFGRAAEFRPLERATGRWSDKVCRRLERSMVVLYLESSPLAKLNPPENLNDARTRRIGRRSPNKREDTRNSETDTGPHVDKHHWVIGLKAKLSRVGGFAVFFKRMHPNLIKIVIKCAKLYMLMICEFIP